MQPKDRTEGDEHQADEAYFDEDNKRGERVFDARLLQESLSVVGARKPVILSAEASVTEAVRAMQREHRGCVLITEDGTANSRLIGIFTERDVLFRIVDRGRNPAILKLGEAMTEDPEALVVDSSVAWILNKMSVGGFRHVPVVDAEGRPVTVVSVRDIVDFLVDHFPYEVQNLPTEFGADRQKSREGA